MVSILVNLSNFFSLFAALNIAYAGSKRFRMTLNEDILNVDDIQHEIDRLQSVYQNIEYDTNNNENIELKKELETETLKFKEKQSVKYQEFKESRKKYGEFKRTYKRMFTASSFFCMLLLLMIGFESVYSEQIQIILCCSQLIILLLIYIFLSGFINSKGKSIVNAPSTFISVVIVFIIILTGLILSLFKYETNTATVVNLEMVVWSSVLIAVLPYALYFTKAFLYRRENKTIFADYKVEMMREKDLVTDEMTKILTKYAFRNITTDTN